MLWAPGGEVLSETFEECVFVYVCVSVCVCVCVVDSWLPDVHRLWMLEVCFASRASPFSLSPHLSSLAIPRPVSDLLFLIPHWLHLFAVTLHFGHKEAMPQNICEVYDHRRIYRNEAAISQILTESSHTHTPFTHLLSLVASLTLRRMLITKPAVCLVCVF